MSNELTVIARNAEEMAGAQSELVSWAAMKIKEAHEEFNHLEQNLQIATENGWKTSGLAMALGIARRKVRFYDKMLAALEAGYVIVPNFPIDVFAIRTAKSRPKRGDTTRQWDEHRQSSELPAKGEGCYVSDRPAQMQQSYERSNDKGEIITTHNYWADAFQEVDFPAAFAKPQILDAASKAMALKVFDEIGILPARRQKCDPMVIGQIVFKKGSNERRVSFLITWWLSAEHLEV